TCRSTAGRSDTNRPTPISAGTSGSSATNRKIYSGSDPTFGTITRTISLNPPTGSPRPRCSKYFAGSTAGDLRQTSTGRPNAWNSKTTSSSTTTISSGRFTSGNSFAQKSTSTIAGITCWVFPTGKNTDRRSNRYTSQKQI